MGRVKFVANKRGISEVMSGGAVQGMLREHADKAVEVAEGFSTSGKAKYRSDVSVIGDRAMAIVATTDIVSMRSNAKHNSLEKARHAC